MSTEILFCGDVHGHLRHVVCEAMRLRPMAVVLLGDIETPRPLHVELAPIKDMVWWIAGNHDTDRAASWSNLVDSELSPRRLDGRVVTLADGTRLAGLGGVFRKEVWTPPESPRFESYEAWLASLQHGWQKRESMFAAQRLKHRSTIFPADYYGLAAQTADVLVTHEAGVSNQHGFEAIDELASAMGVQASFHGHHHVSQAYRDHWGALGFRAFGVGLRAVVNRSGEVVVPSVTKGARSEGGPPR